jgi:hypothetical protein
MFLDKRKGSITTRVEMAVTTVGSNCGLMLKVNAMEHTELKTLNEKRRNKYGNPSRSGVRTSRPISPKTRKTR